MIMKSSVIIMAVSCIVGITVAQHANAADVYIIANNASAITADDVRDIFVGDKQIANGTKIVPIDNASKQKDFLQKSMKMDINKYNIIWTKKGFRDGINAPLIKSDDSEVISIVKSVPGAVGYVANVPKDVKVIIIIQ